MDKIWNFTSYFFCHCFTSAPFSPLLPCKGQLLKSPHIFNLLNNYYYCILSVKIPSPWSKIPRTIRRKKTNCIWLSKTTQHTPQLLSIMRIMCRFANCSVIFYSATFTASPTNRSESDLIAVMVAYNYGSLLRHNKQRSSSHRLHVKSRVQTYNYFQLKILIKLILDLFYYYFAKKYIGIITFLV